MSSLKQNPIISAFKSAGRLVNEWRDTILYATAAGAMASHFIFGADLSPIAKEITNPDNVLCVLANRELGRMFAWFFGPSQHAAAAVYTNAALSLANIGARSLLHGTPFNSFAAGLNVLLPLAWMVATGVTPKAAFKLYKDLLFDYPRKNKPPRDRETEKAKAKFQDFWAQIKEKRDALLPAPTLAPVPIPTKRAIVAQSASRTHLAA